MSVVIEHGTARCPRCAAAAGYTFHDAGDHSLRYTVTCRRCMNVHTEICTVAPANGVAA
jgi:hypothetical protein